MHHAKPMARAVMDGCEYTLTGKCYAAQCANFSTAWPSIGMAGTGKSHLGCYTRRGWRAFFQISVDSTVPLERKGNTNMDRSGVDGIILAC